MTISLREDAKYSLVTPTSMGVRLTPHNGQPFQSSSEFTMTATSAESNVGSVSSYLGMPVKVLTNFVADSPISAFIKSNLLARKMHFEGPEVPQGDAWGFRHQFNLADSGSKDTSKFCLDIARAAKKHGSRISFDLNHRASFWKGREQELSEIFTEIASLSDILVGNEEDFQLCLGLEGPEEGGEDLAGKIDNFKTMINTAKTAFPDTAIFATTLREVVSANHHRWGGIVSTGSDWHVVEPRDITVLDRIGGGDGFVGGLLYGVLKGWSGVAATMLTDYGQPADEEQVWSIWSGNARVKR